MIKQKTILIQNAAKIKDGVTNGKSWELWKIIDSDAVEYTTFQPARYVAAMNAGAEIQVSFDESQTTLRNGSKVWNRGLIEPKNARTPSKQLPQDKQETNETLAKILNTLQRIEEKQEIILNNINPPL